MKQRILLFILPALILLAGCKEDTPIGNMPPQTTIFLTSINLTGDDRISSVVELFWSGEDADGYVKGYELSFDETSWDFVTTQDSTFRFTIEADTDTVDITFFVRAIDNNDVADPTPASLVIPIKNTPPTATLDTITFIPDTVYSVFSSVWSVDDRDGSETVEATYIKLNEGNWLQLDPSVTFATFEPTAPMQSGTQNAKLYLGLDASLYPEEIEGYIVGDTNRLYIRSEDISGAFSEVDTSNVFYVTQQTSDLIVIDAHTSLGALTPEEVYFPILDNVYPSYDYWDFARTDADLVTFYDPTFEIFLSLYDKVFWYSDGAPEDIFNGNQLFMEAAAQQLQIFLNNGGKLLATSPFSFDDPVMGNQSPIFGFSPMDSLSTSSAGQARIPPDSMAIPTTDFEMDYSPLMLRPGTFIIGADPFYPKNVNDVMYDVQLLITGGWVGPRTICGRTVFTNGETNQIFFSAELHLFSGDEVSLEAFFDQVFNSEFNW